MMQDRLKSFHRTLDTNFSTKNNARKTAPLK